MQFRFFLISKSSNSTWWHLCSKPNTHLYILLYLLLQRLFREVLGLWLVQLWRQRQDVRSWLCCPLPRLTVQLFHSMPFLSIWLAAISMTLMMKAMAKAQIRLFLTHVCLFFFLGWTEIKEKTYKRITALFSYFCCYLSLWYSWALGFGNQFVRKFVVIYPMLILTQLERLH